MRIDSYPSPKQFGARVLAKTLRIGDEESLLGSVTVDDGSFTASSQRALQRVVSSQESAVIGDVLAEGEIAIHM